MCEDEGVSKTLHCHHSPRSFFLSPTTTGPTHAPSSNVQMGVRNRLVRVEAVLIKPAVQHSTMAGACFLMRWKIGDTEGGKQRKSEVARQADQRHFVLLVDPQCGFLADPVTKLRDSGGLIRAHFNVRI